VRFDEPGLNICSEASHAKKNNSSNMR